MVSAPDFKNLERLMPLVSDLFMCLNQAGSVVYVTGPWKSLTGYDNADLLGTPYIHFLSPDDRELVGVAVEEAMKENGQVSFMSLFNHVNGHSLCIAWSGFRSEEGLWLVGKIVSDQVAENQKRIEKDELHRVLVEHGSDMLALFDEEVNFIYSSGSTERILNYTHEQLEGVNALSLIHPDDLPLVQEKLEEVLASRSYATIPEFRFKHSNGNWRWLETTVSNQLHNPAVKALVTSSRDVTERRDNKQLLLESEQRFKSLFEDNPDMILVENRQGFVIDANRATCFNLGVPKEKVMGRHISEFLHPDAIPVCMEYLQQAFEGEAVHFTLDIKEADSVAGRVLDVTKVPVKVNGTVLAVHTVMKDVTVVTSYQRINTQQSKKLTTIFESITDAFCMIGRDWHYTYANSEFERLAQQSKEHFVGKHFFDIYPESTNNDFYKHYAFAMETGESVHFEAFSPELKLWLSIKAFPSEEGLSIYFTDITERIKIQEDLHRLSLVARHTTNGVVISDAERRIEWVNEGFTRLTGYSNEEAVGHVPFELLHQHVPDVKPFELVRENMLMGQPVSFEIESRKKNGETLWLLLQVNPILNKEGKLSRYVTIQSDITEKKKTQHELEKLSQVASRTDNSVVITDAAGRVEWVNAAFSNITGYSMSEAFGKKPGEFLQGPETDREDIRAVSKKLKCGEHFSTVLLNYKKSGEKFWVSMDITPIYDSKGDITQFIAIQKDITIRRETEASMHNMTQELYRQNTDLQQFTYIVSHNLRAPVANALGLSKMLTKMNKHSERYDKSIDYLHQSMLRLDTVLNDMNTILSIRDRKGALDQELVDIRSILDQVLYFFEETLIKCGGIIENGIQAGLEVKANRAYLYSIFHNLLSNAIKYRSEHRTLRVNIACLTYANRGTLISFSDNGMGFDTSKAAGNMFKLYKRFHADKKGRGIGLYLVKAHLEAMGGHVEVSSQVGSGTTFLIYLPK